MRVTRICWSDFRVALRTRNTYARFVVGLMIVALGNFLVDFILQYVFGSIYTWLHTSVQDLFWEFVLLINVITIFSLFFSTLYGSSRDIARERIWLQKYKEEPKPE